MVNDLRRLATVVDNLPTVDIFPDPYDNFLLAMAQLANADILVTGDKRDLLALSRDQSTRILTARAAAGVLLGCACPRSRGKRPSDGQRYVAEYRPG